LCDFAWPIMDSFNTPDHIGDPTLPNQLFSAVTGAAVDEASLTLYGERIFNLQRGILLREGWQPKESDSPPEFNFTEPVNSSVSNPYLIVPGPDQMPLSIKGNTLDKDKYHEMRHEYYLLRDWEPKSGLQKKNTLERIGLSDVSLELGKRGLLKYDC
jgi:aldehyde:ferredoxin oxidoreductase